MKAGERPVCQNSGCRCVRSRSRYRLGPMLAYMGASVFAFGRCTAAPPFARGPAAGTLMVWRIPRSRAFWFSLLIIDFCQAVRCASMSGNISLAGGLAGAACLVPATGSAAVWRRPVDALSARCRTGCRTGEVAIDATDDGRSTGICRSSQVAVVVVEVDVAVGCTDRNADLFRRCEEPVRMPCLLLSRWSAAAKGAFPDSTAW